MSHSEDLLRRELHARADLADAAHAPEPRAAVLAGLEGRITRTRRRRVVARSAAASAIAVAAAIVLPLAFAGRLPHTAIGQAGPGGAGQVLLSDPSLTPPGWTAVPFRDAQVSIPSSWFVQTAAGSICGLTTGGLLMGHSLASLRAFGCRLPESTVLMTRAPRHLSPASARVLNGIAVIGVKSGYGSVSYVAPALHVEVTVIGPMARQVIATLTRSPLSVALARGPAFAVPRSWRWHYFGGLKFAAPGFWKLNRARTWGDCAYKVVFADTVQLSTAVRWGCSEPLPSLLGLAGEWAQLPGVSVGTGPFAVFRGLETSCRRLHGLRACIPAYSGSNGSPLGLEVYVPGRANPTTVEIGLAGTGAISRTILDSIRPASS